MRKQLEARKRRIDQVYFIEAGFASVVANGTGKPSIEVGIIGREGMSGLAIVLGHDRAQHETYIQVAGTGLRISASNLRAAIEHSTTLHRATRVTRMRSSFRPPPPRSPMGAARSRNALRAGS